MDCVNHSGTTATSFCQSCGKPLCAGCARMLAGGEIVCPNCQPSWQGYAPAPPMPPVGGPNPAVAGALGLIPGVGAMYNGQFLKGLIHVVIFAVLVNLADHFGIFGLFIAFWVIYQVFEAYQTARAIRFGMPVPDPLGLNQLIESIRPGSSQGRVGEVPPVSPAPMADAGQGYAGGQPPYPPPMSGMPPVPPVPPPSCGPLCGGRNVPIGAIVLILLGVFFLLGQLDILHGRVMEFFWPVLLIAIGIWLVVRRVSESQGGPQ